MSEKILSVGLGDRAYPIYIGAGLLANKRLFAEFVGALRPVIVTDEHVADLFLSTVMDTLDEEKTPCIVLPSGEEHKTLTDLYPIYDTLLENTCGRDTLLIALGGGVVGDMAGFAAATYQRGIPFLQLPTTLLAQVDSSVGGKTGVNHVHGKNMIGAFWQPKAVFIDTDTLKKLPDREYTSGLAEIIKYGLIGDMEFFTWLENNIGALRERGEEALTHAIYRSCQNKASMVETDEREKGRRALLNLGHTFAHAIEAAQNYKVLLHGEAVSIGTVLAARMSEKLGFLTTRDGERVLSLLKAAGLPTDIPRDPPAEQIIALMHKDKKSIGQKLRVIALRRLGQAEMIDAPEEDFLLSLFE